MKIFLTTLFLISSMNVFAECNSVTGAGCSESECKEAKLAWKEAKCFDPAAAQKSSTDCAAINNGSSDKSSDVTKPTDGKSTSGQTR